MPDPGSTIAIDVPSGVGDGYRPGLPAILAEVTLTMGLPKLCLYLPRARALCGKIYVVPVGFPPALVEDPGHPGELLYPRAWRPLAPQIPPDTHKNRRGHLAVFAGVARHDGRRLAVRDGRRALPRRACDAFRRWGSYPVLAPKLTSVMCRPWDVRQTLRSAGVGADRMTAVLVGPGWGLADVKARGWITCFPSP